MTLVYRFTEDNGPFEADSYRFIASDDPQKTADVLEEGEGCVISGWDTVNVPNSWVQNKNSSLFYKAAR